MKEKNEEIMEEGKRENEPIKEKNEEKMEEGIKKRMKQSKKRMNE